MLDLEIDPKLAWALQTGRCSRLILTEAAVSSFCACLVSECEA